jgi:hypothetical protein
MGRRSVCRGVAQAIELGVAEWRGEEGEEMNESSKPLRFFPHPHLIPARARLAAAEQSSRITPAQCLEVWQPGS